MYEQYSACDFWKNIWVWESNLIFYTSFINRYFYIREMYVLTKNSCKKLILEWHERGVKNESLETHILHSFMHQDREMMQAELKSHVNEATVITCTVCLHVQYTRISRILLVLKTRSSIDLGKQHALTIFRKKNPVLLRFCLM